MKKTVILTILSSSVALICAPVYAADADKEAGGGLELQEILVTAQKREENLQTVPVSALVIGSEALASQNQNSLQSLTQTTSGVRIGGSGLNDDMYIRGIGSGQSQTFSQAVATFIDGVYHGRSRSSSATFLDLERVEILKGPQSTFFGNNAIAGAINITTKKPGNQAEGFVRALYGMYRQYAVEAGVTVPVSDSLSLRGAAILDGQRGWLENITTGERAPRQNNKVGRLTFRYTPSEDLDVTLKLEAGDNRQDGTAYSGGLQFVGCGRPAAFRAFYDPLGDCAKVAALGLPQGFDSKKYSGVTGQSVSLETQEAVLTVNYDTTMGTLTSVTAYSASQYKSNADGSALPDSVADTSSYLGQFPEKYRQFSQELRLASPLGDTFEYLVGAYFQSDNTRTAVISAFNFFTPFLTPPPIPTLVTPAGSFEGYDQDQQVYGLFGSLSWNVTEKLKLTGGLRATWDNKQADITSYYGSASSRFGGTITPYDPIAASIIASGFFGRPAGFSTPSTQGSFKRKDDALLPSAKIQYQIDRRVMAYASYSRGFLGGGFNNRDTTGNPVNVPFGSEFVDAYEIGLKSKFFDNRVLLNIAAFRSDYDNLQVTSYTPIGANVYLQSVRNAASSRSQGIEVESQLLIAPIFRVAASVTYLDTAFRSYQNGPATFNQAAGIDVPGCVVQPDGVCVGTPLAVQDLSGRRTNSAPKWSGSLTATLDVPVSADYNLVAELTPFYTTSYFVGNDAADPYFRQKSYMRLDGRISLKNDPNNWSIDLIGRNLTDKNIFQAGITGLRAIKGPPRTVAIQLRHSW